MTQKLCLWSCHEWHLQKQANCLAFGRWWVFPNVPTMMIHSAYWKKWTTTSENVPSDMCVKRRYKSACASAQSDQSLHYPHEETLHPWLSKMCPVKILIRLRECAVWSESSLVARARRYIFWTSERLKYWYRKPEWSELPVGHTIIKPF